MVFPYMASTKSWLTAGRRATSLIIKQNVLMGPNMIAAVD